VATADTTLVALFACWKEWCQENGEFPGASRTFSQRLVDLGLDHHRTKQGAAFRGVKIGVTG
jgi:phage/plasmid-associated DNA primase